MKILKSIWAGLEHLGRIRAASIMAREGYSSQAIDILNKK
jgi:hypothetical protein